ncbi:uncharacterized protein [Palaemon carinicauda]|uniref:uncharacterized protein n=1 Tax=Palaemon carinicauda TaxID=392227 RepID=UPI0035B57843
MVNRELRRYLLFPWEDLVLLAMLLLTATCQPHSHPTRVPGSKHLVVQTDFPYEYWRPSPKPYRQAVPSTVTSAPASYGFYYGESSKDYEIDASAWKMLPIQLPDDLVGAVNERTTQTTNPAPTAPTYPTTAIPQYGRHPGVTERPHLFHPERLYTHVKDSDGSYERLGSNGLRHPHQQYHSHGNMPIKDHSEEAYQIPQPLQKPNRFRKPQNSWQNGILENLDSFVATHSPQGSKGPRFPSMNSIPRYPAWHSSNSQEDYDYDTQITDDKHAHHSYPIPRPALKKHRRNKRPNHFLNSGEQTIILSTPPMYDYDEALSVEDHHTHFGTNQNSFFDNSLEFIRNKIRPQANRRKVYLNRRRPFRRQQAHRPEYHESNSNDPWDAHLFDMTEHDSDYPSALPNRVQSPPQNSYNRPLNNRFRPNSGIRPNWQKRPYGNQGSSANSPNAQSAPPPSPPPLHQRPMNPSGIKRPQPHWNSVSEASDVDYDYGILDRLSDVNPLTSSVTVRGGMLVVALALALFYFNFVWYPTPVVTARLIKLISDSVPDDVIDSEKQKAIGEVYEVFRSLETEYIQDPNLWQPSCKSRLVCQVHHELPGLWQITYTYEAVVRRSLATGPQGDDELTVFLKAAEDGNQGSDCNELFKSCPMEPVPVRSYLQKLIGIGDSETLPTVVYS